MKPADVSVVIPTLNEAAVITDAVTSALEAGAVEVIVSDGGSQDETIERAGMAGATTIVQSTAGRGTQLNQGASVASGEFVLFLHADCRLGSECLQQICQSGDLTWGAFRQQIASTGPAYRLLEFGNALRVSVRGMPFGDQAIFVSRNVLNEQGGVAEIPLMEDVALSGQLRRIARPILLAGPVIVDARRWQRRGILRQTLRNWSIQAAYACGVSPQRLNQWYRW